MIIMQEQNNPYVLQNVSYSYAKNGVKFEALKNINLTIESGEFVAIVGASGSGKSTLLNLLGMMALPSLGNLSFFGAPVEGLSSDELATLRNNQLGFIFQQFHLLPKLNVLDNVMLGAHYGSQVSLRDIKKRALELLLQFGLESQIHKFPPALSGGQKQRVALCRALLLNPKIILADEPTGALDTKNAALVMQQLKNLNALGHTIVVITHDLEIASQASRIVRIKDGQIETFESHVSSDSELQNNSKTHPSAYSSDAKLNQVGRRFSLIFGLFYQAVRLSVQNMTSNLMRSALTVFGLAIGILSMVVMVTLSGAMRDTFKNKFQTLGGQISIIYYQYNNKSAAPPWRGLNLSTDLKAVNTLVALKGMLEPLGKDIYCSVKSVEKETKQSIGAYPSAENAKAIKLELSQGRFFTPAEMLETGTSHIAILGDDTLNELFPTLKSDRIPKPNYPIGELLKVENCDFNGTLKIVGVLKKNTEDTMFEASPNTRIFVPTQLFGRYRLSEYASAFKVIPVEGQKSKELAQYIAGYLKLISGNKFELKVFSLEDLVSKINLMMLVLSALTVVVGCICAATGGVGVMNIMLVNMTERIREIGLRKALGAKAHHIRNMFLIESGVLCFIAGIAGVAVGLALSNIAFFVGAELIPELIEYYFLFNVYAVSVALVLCFGAGLLFGLLPAKKAGAMDVVEALRQE